MEKAKTTTETARATVKENEKTIVDEVMVELKTTKFSPEHQILHGSLKLPSGTPLLPTFYQLVLEDGRSYRILVKGVHLSGRGEKRPVHFLVVPEE